jgi:predicted transcriptional regulator
MYLGNLSFDLLQKYLGLLMNYGLIEVENDNEKAYVATEKGRRFLEDFYKLQEYSEKAQAKKRTLEEYLSS